MPGYKGTPMTNIKLSVTKNAYTYIFPKCGLSVEATPSFCWLFVTLMGELKGISLFFFPFPLLPLYFDLFGDQAVCDSRTHIHCHFAVQMFAFSMLSCRNSFWVLVIFPLSVIYFASIFPLLLIFSLCLWWLWCYGVSKCLCCKIHQSEA